MQVRRRDVTFPATANETERRTAQVFFKRVTATLFRPARMAIMVLKLPSSRHLCHTMMGVDDRESERMK
jgi:hypothetical protein